MSDREVKSEDKESTRRQSLIFIRVGLEQLGSSEGSFLGGGEPAVSTSRLCGDVCHSGLVRRLPRRFIVACLIFAWICIEDYTVVATQGFVDR